MLQQAGRQRQAVHRILGLHSAARGSHRVLRQASKQAVHGIVALIRSSGSVAAALHLFALSLSLPLFEPLWLLWLLELLGLLTLYKLIELWWGAGRVVARYLEHRRCVCVCGCSCSCVFVCVCECNCDEGGSKFTCSYARQINERRVEVGEGGGMYRRLEE
jgi:hypothetical protein